MPSCLQCLQCGGGGVESNFTVQLWSEVYFLVQDLDLGQAEQLSALSAAIVPQRWVCSI